MRRWASLAYLAVCVAVVVGIVWWATLPLSGAVSQVTVLYGCAHADGTVTVRQYEPPCRDGQRISWPVRPG